MTTLGQLVLLPWHHIVLEITDILLKPSLHLPGSINSYIYCGNVLSTLASTHTTPHLQQQNVKPLLDALFSKAMDSI